jgi:hypothetical protein
LIAGLPAAVVTLAWAMSKPLPMIDDWSFIAQARAGSGFLWSSRPGEALLHWAVFTGADSHPVPPLLVLAAENVVVGACLWMFCRRRFGVRVATLAALAWAVLPNRGSTRMWSSCIPNLAAGALAAAALVIADHDDPSRRRTALVVALAVASCLTYEGAGALAAAAVVLVAVHQHGRSRRIETLAAGGLAMAAALAWVGTHSAKTGRLHIAAYANRLASTQFGIGLWPARALVLGLAMFVVMVLAVFAPLLGRRRWSEESAITWGAGGMVLGAIVFYATGFPIADTGLFDRGNAYTDFGTSVVIAGVLALIWRYRPVLGAACAGSVLALLAWGNVAAVRSYVQSAADARAVMADVRRLPEFPAGPIVIGPLPNHAGVAGFTAAYDIQAAMAVHYHLDRPPRVRVTVTDAQAAALVGKDAVYRYCAASGRLIDWPRSC